MKKLFLILLISISFVIAKEQIKPVRTDSLAIVAKQDSLQLVGLKNDLKQLQSRAAQYKDALKQLDGAIQYIESRIKTLEK